MYIFFNFWHFIWHFDIYDILLVSLWQHANAEQFCTVECRTAGKELLPPKPHILPLLKGFQ